MTAVHFATLSATPTKAWWCAGDYIAFLQSAHKLDLIKGAFVMASPASSELETARRQGLTWVT